MVLPLPRPASTNRNVWFLLGIRLCHSDILRPWTTAEYGQEDPETLFNSLLLRSEAKSSGLGPVVIYFREATRVPVRIMNARRRRLPESPTSGSVRSPDESLRSVVYREHISAFGYVSSINPLSSSLSILYSKSGFGIDLAINFSS